MDYNKDYYNILGVDQRATPEMLRNSYRRLAKLYHPDKNPNDPSAEERFKIINEAYEVLSNEVSRHVYDSYRAENKKEDPPKQPTSKGTPQPNKPFTKTKTRTYKVTRTKRIYLKGSIEIKFQGEPELFNTYMHNWEQRYAIIPTEVLATVTSSSIYKDWPPKEYQLSYSTAELFKTPLKQPVNCKIVTGNKEEHYKLDLYDIRVKDPSLKDITKHENYSFGTLEGNLFCYILQQYEEEVTEEYTEYYGATGQVEIKNEAGHTYTRQQFYAADSSTYWTEWKRSSTTTRKYNTARESINPVLHTQKNSGVGCAWLIFLLIIVAIWPKFLFLIIAIIALFLILSFLNWFISAFGKVLPWLAGLAIALIIITAMRSLFFQANINSRNIVSNRRVDSIKSERTIVHEQNKEADTIIKHTLTWQDRDSARYLIQLYLSSSVLKRSSNAHRQMDYQRYARQGIGAVYRSMLATDSYFLNPIATAFDSLARSRALDMQKKASMIVSCIQSIPYSLVVEGACSSSYNDDFVKRYLANCEDDCCKGYSKFGIQSPVEFIGDLKGDCDTRALLLYELLRKLGYKVALLTSNYYKHAVIAVHLNEIQVKEAAAIQINGESYYLWETTSKGFGPGELPAAFSNINYWQIALIQ